MDKYMQAVCRAEREREKDRERERKGGEGGGRRFSTLLDDKLAEKIR